MKGKKRYYRGIYCARKAVNVKMMIREDELTPSEVGALLVSTDMMYSWGKTPADFFIVIIKGNGWADDHWRTFTGAYKEEAEELRRAIKRVGKPYVEA